ncbi:LysR substrate-binding domain-containing protein [Massilia sp. BSC265]|uniref:LysR substrate-binding domain-containing protein n=1 Tax=Massilia sp. BSC265 TaxID=1549812 RepID=UPI0004E90296|nr:LysR substrate-binding domain-containing protein [Massilia sp. BSC265]KFI06599.1 LysR family transcriptional regulator [Massilia sp. BSC265]
MAVIQATMDTGSFSNAAERLEDYLRMTLMHRTTRRLQLTEEGSWLLGRARSLLADLANTEAEAAARRSQPSGLVRVNAATPALDHLLAPLVPEFLDQYPLVQLELVSGETYVDLIEERADLAIRIGALPDSTLNARRLGSSRVRVLAAPAYIERHGLPVGVEALKEHRTLGFTAPALLNTWPLRHAGGEGWTVAPGVVASSGETIRHLALAGAGVASLSDFLTRADVAAGRLVPVLEEATLPWAQPVWAVFYKQGSLAPRVAALVDFLARRLQEVLDR